MGTKLEGKTFFTCQNNGVEALISEAIADNRSKAFDIARVLSEHEFEKRPLIESALAHLPRGPIFTFVSLERFGRSPWFTGTHRDLKELCAYIEEEGGKVTQGSFCVPFSNGAETGLHGASAQLSELAYVTGADEFESIFGIGLNEIMQRSFRRDR